MPEMQRPMWISSAAIRPSPLGGVHFLEHFDREVRASAAVCPACGGPMLLWPNSIWIEGFDDGSHRCQACGATFDVYLLSTWERLHQVSN